MSESKRDQSCWAWSPQAYESDENSSVSSHSCRSNDNQSSDDSSISSRDGDVRVEILRQSGGRRRPIEWFGRDRWLREVEESTTLENLTSCFTSLGHAQFDRWDPAVPLACPCCARREIPVISTVQESLEILRQATWEWAIKSGRVMLETSPSVQLPKVALQAAWDTFRNVKSNLSGHGLCLCTRSCSSSPLKASRRHSPWSENHARWSCGAQTRNHLHNLGAHSDHVNERISRLQFIEGLTQVLGLTVPWPIIISVLQRFAVGHSIDFVTFARLLSCGCKDVAGLHETAHSSSYKPRQPRWLRAAFNRVCDSLDNDGLTLPSAFAAFDSAQDGLISVREWVAALSRMSPPLGESKKRMREMFAAIDRTMSRTITPLEFTSYFANLYRERLRYLEGIHVELRSGSRRELEIRDAVRCARRALISARGIPSLPACRRGGEALRHVRLQHLTQRYTSVGETFGIKANLERQIEELRSELLDVVENEDNERRHQSLFDRKGIEENKMGNVEEVGSSKLARAIADIDREDWVQTSRSRFAGPSTSAVYRAGLDNSALARSLECF